MRYDNLIDVGKLIDALVARKPPEPFEFKCGTLAACTPPPHVALDPEYLAMNEDFIEVDEKYLLTIAFQAGMEQGYRYAMNEHDEQTHYDLPWPMEHRR